MDDNQLHTFRKEWKDEIKKKLQIRSLEKNESGMVLENTVCMKNESLESSSDIFTPELHGISSNTQKALYGETKNHQRKFLDYKKQKPEPESLLTIGIPSYQQSNFKKNKEHISSNTLTSTGETCASDQDFISLLIRDIDEITTIPFFDVSLPKEVCIKIFANLDVIDLCHCACVSKAWSALANDNLIWQNIYKQLGFERLPGARVSDQSDWKIHVKENVLRQRLVERNWKEMICKTQTLEYEKGIALSACKLFKNVLVAGYANGKTCLWDTGNNWRHFLEPSSEVIEDASKASAECVSLHGDICASSFMCGMVNIWHTDISVHPVYQYKLSKPSNHVILACLDNDALLLTSCDTDIRIDQIQDDGQWGIVRSKSFENQITAINLLPSDSDNLFAIAMKEDVVMYKPKTDSLVNLDTIIGTKITAMTTNGQHIAVGWAPYGFGVGTEFTTKVRLYDKNTLRHTQTFVGQYGEITCINLSYVGSVVTGSKDKQVRIYDFRTEQPQLCFQVQSSSITTVQMDSWKVVSGFYSGTVKVWDMRMATVLWETAGHHPVRLCQFHHNQLVTANIPLDKVPKESLWYADDLILHRRHRGSVKVYDFSGSPESVVVPEEMRSSYDNTAGYNYNINLVAPYDELTSEIN